MPAKLLYFPYSWLSARRCEEIPAIATALANLRAVFDVEVAAAPLFKGDVENLRRDEWAQLWRGRFTAGCHVVADASRVSEAIAALSGQTAVASFVANGFFPSAATQEALGLSDAYAVAAAGFSSGVRRQIYQFVRSSMRTASESEVVRLAHEITDELDHDAYARASEAWMTWDLVADAPLISIPTLYLAPPDRVVGMAEMTRAFLHFVPDAEVQTLELYGTQDHIGRTGKEFSASIIGFIKRTAAGARGGRRSLRFW